MSKLALKIVEAIQHSLLGSLLVALIWPPLFFFSQAARIGADRSPPDLFAASFLVLVPLAFFAWLLGAVARGARPPVSAMDRLHKDAANGFDIWFCPPEGGLRPSAFMRRLVTLLGRDPERKPSGLHHWLGLLPVFAVLGGLGLLVWAESGLSVERLPWLAIDENRRLIAYILAGVLTVFSLQNWASRQRLNLAPLP